MTSPVTEQRGNLMLGLVLGALAGIIAIVLAWFALVPRTAVTATTTPSPTAASTEPAPADPASTPSADATSAPTSTATPVDSASPADTPSATPNPNVVTELQAGTWVTVLKSLPQGSVSAEEALAQAATMGNEMHRPVVLDSNAFGFTPNYWVVAVPGAASAQDAVAVCTDLHIDDRNRCYPREVKG